MTTERIYEFIVLAQTLNFNKAARQLFLTQSILSRHIIEMEKEFGFKLFIRNTRNVALTEAGKRLAEDMVRVLNDCDSAVTRLRINGRNSSSTLSVFCTDSCVCNAYVEFIRRFSAEHPDIDLQTSATHGPMHPGRWMRYDFFFSLSTYSNIPKHYEMFRTFRQPAHLIFSHDHELYGTEKISLSQLAGQTLLVPRADELFGPYAKNKQLAEKCTSGSVKVISSPTIPTAMLHASLGLGVAIIPSSLLQRVNQNIGSCEIIDRECNFDLHMYTNTSKQDYAMRTFMGAVLQECGIQPGR